METFLCTICGEEHPLSDCYEIGGDTLCPDCASDHTVICECCGGRIYLDDAVGGESYTLCQTCYDCHYCTCSDCGHFLASENAYYLDDDDDSEPLCYDCYCRLSQNRKIQDYSYHPDPIFYGEGSRFFGVELEIDNGGKLEKNAGKLLAIGNQNDPHIYIKSDGSLDDGLEIVTHPMTLDYHLSTLPWESILQEAVTMGYLSHRAGTCGLHVHINRTAFGLSEDEQEIAIARLLFFVEKFWTEMLRFSRRSQRQIDRWAARYGMKLRPKEVMDTAKKSCAGRYTCINLTNQDTVEIRIFRGTLKLNTLTATLQLVNHLCNVAVSLSDEELQALSWHDFLEQITEPELIRYLKERNLYKNDPVTAEEDD